MSAGSSRGIPNGVPRILIPSDVHWSIKPISVCSVAQLRCDGVGPVGWGIKIKDSAWFKRRWIVSMVVANGCALGRTWLLGPIKQTLLANVKMRIDE